MLVINTDQFTLSADHARRVALIKKIHRRRIYTPKSLQNNIFVRIFPRKQMQGSKQSLNGQNCSAVKKESENIHHESIPDGGYGWVICCAGFVVQFIVLGIHNSFGILFTYLMMDLKSGASETGW
jgi:hypothetical protein